MSRGRMDSGRGAVWGWIWGCRRSWGRWTAVSTTTASRGRGGGTGGARGGGLGAGKGRRRTGRAELGAAASWAEERVQVVTRLAAAGGGRCRGGEEKWGERRRGQRRGDWGLSESLVELGHEEDEGAALGLDRGGKAVTGFELGGSNRGSERWLAVAGQRRAAGRGGGAGVRRGGVELA